MLCDPSERQKRSNLVTTTVLPPLQGNQCVPGTHWKQECNSCWCSDNGFAACTLKGCLGHGHKFHHRNQFKPIDTETTTLGSTSAGLVSNKVKRGSDLKGFQKNHESLKSRNTPNPDAQKEPKVENQSIVTSAPKRPNDYESTSGKVYTEADIQRPDFKCIASESFKVECNTCWCAASGNAVRYCTRQACNPKVYPTLAPTQ